jgi:hypothetical protein
MDQFQLFLCPEPSLQWKRKASLLPCETRLAEFVGVLDVWESLYQSTLHHLLQTVEVEMAEPRMPALGIGLEPHG